MKDWLIPLLAGFGTGILSSWGVGGGTLLLLIMTLFLGVDQQMAQGINLLYFLPTAALGLVSHKKNGLLDRDAFRAAVPWGTVSAAGCAFLATAVDTEILRRPFGIFLLFAAAATMWQTRKK